ncbi:MAG: serine/threonine protein kinase [Phycisphaerales bacterium]|nr:serine/threonine protein kinase [Phycisphaerales bacterium]
MQFDRPEKAVGPERIRELIADAQRQSLRTPPPRGDSSGLRLNDNPPHALHTEIETVLSRELPGYDLRGQTHRGGQGVVYRATQRSTGRDVAIKVMRQGPFASRSERMRFEREVQVLGRLHHPDIVTIHDSGLAAGHFYLVTDFVDGVPLDRFAAASGRKIRPIVALFERICQAVNAAHLCGVTHRDLKPANILVDSDGRPRVLDFGLAKLDEPVAANFPECGDSTAAAHSSDEAFFREEFTIAGEFLGSIPWCSPEQAAGALIDIRSDVYSLGVMLYRALTGRFPYTTSGPLDVVLGAVRGEPPASPRDVRRDVDGDLATILLKCLEKQPGNRYQTAGELARDLSRWQRGEPIEAKRSSTAYLLRMTLRRHWLAAGVGGISLVLIVGALIAVFVALRAAQRERDAARLEAEKAQAVTDFLSEMLNSADPNIARGRDPTIREALAGAQRDLDTGRFAKDADVEAALRVTLGKTYASLSRFGEASDQLTRAMASLEQLHGAVGAELIAPLVELSRVRRKQGAFQEGESLARRALEIAETTFGPNSVDVAAPLATLAFAVRERGGAQETEALLKRRLSILRAVLSEENPDVLLATVDLAQCAANHDEAVKLLDGALQLARARIPDDHPAYVRILRATAQQKMMRREYAESESAFLDALRRAREIFGSESAEVHTILSELTMVYRFAGRKDDLSRALDEATRVARRVFGNESVEVARNLFDQCIALEEAGRMADAELLAEESLGMLEQLGQPDCRLSAVIHIWLADRAIETREWDRAETLANEVLAVDAHQLSPFTWPHGAAKSVLGAIEATRGDPAEAEALLLSGIEQIGEGRLSRAHRKLAIQRLVAYYEASGAIEHAERWRGRLDPAP